ncbi:MULTISPECIES: sodium:alanine symporter family protein [unclassified Saccharopolyspora]|uniref:alanine/glycine:cation symporter family protein n=1 Tax=unclassified Saccharopolyspora TaxID=2646250 RepID=UPI001CD339F5|nr:MULTISPECIES: alanine/glycine:cation symporter family protein [unclassified Saccharopolyspora]MCA1189143.1 alanine:cation symporter family protein [Saccharopolyspora sp. 6T]MCA1195988.1 alanine:cation symporter family protein [Saccharopolyspora sp. 6V]MCA1283636.1 alanine:cation symporter family protein [Saccharopolyspora sp. 7B]
MPDTSGPPPASPLPHTEVLAAGDGALSAVENTINTVFEPISDWFSNLVFGELTLFGVTFPWIVAWLVIAAATFTVAFGFIQFRSLGLSLALVRGKYSRPDDPGEITHFQALSSAVSATVGLGNIAGVGVAVTVGGPGATFWMIVCGLLGMCTKFVECTLGVQYRDIHEDGTVSGGPMQYLRKGIAERFPGGFGARLGKVLAVLAAIMILFFGIAGGNMFQANQTFAQLRNVTGGEQGWLGGDGAALAFGLVLAALVGAVIIGGIKSIGAATSKLVPTMAIIYVVACLIVIGVNITSVPAALGEIVRGAFTPAAGFGGAIGVLIIGFQRAAFSNEAGLGSAPIAHSAVKTRHPVSEGFVALLEPFVDTVIICTMTALTIVIARTEFWLDAQRQVLGGGETPDGVTVTSEAFATVLPWFPYVLTLAVALFAISTIITWGYYGQRAWLFLFGKSKAKETAYNVLFCACTVIGSVLTLTSVLDFADAVLFALALFNIIGLYLLLPVVKRELRSFREKLRTGEVAPVERPEEVG